MVSWSSPIFGDAEKKLVIEVLDSGFVSEGPMTKELEEKLAKVIGVKHIIMTTSCTAALYLAIEADKQIRKYTKGNVIIPSLTFVGTKNAVEMTGLKCIPFEVNGNNYILNNLALQLDNKDTKIVIPVNLLGRSDEWINDELKDEWITIIYDNAGSLGSNVPNGKVGCYSLQSNKLINCGQGGFCATDDDEYAKEIRKLKDFGREDKYDNSSDGFNFKFNDILAAVALGQLETLNERKERHLSIYNKYKKELGEYGEFVDYKDGEIPLWIEMECRSRDNLFEYLKTKEIYCRKPWYPLQSFPNANYYSNNFLWLPTGMHLFDLDITKVINEIKSFYDN